MPPWRIYKARVHGYYDVWGLLRLLALEDVGTAIPEHGPISTQTRTLMKSALAHIHSAGYVHGDIARRNFCKKANVIFLVDLETLAIGSPVEIEAELMHCRLILIPELHAVNFTLNSLTGQSSRSPIQRLRRLYESIRDIYN